MLVPVRHYRLGESDWLSGYVTKRHVLGDLSNGRQLERHLGFDAGRMRSGWYVLFLLEPPKPSDVEFGGYSHFSDGHVEGHLSPERRGPHVERSLEAEYGSAMVSNLKRQVVSSFNVVGYDRITKIVPIWPYGAYPPALEPVPQWKLLRRHQFVVDARYSGYAAK